MRPFIVKKMNLPPSSPDEEPEKEKQSEDDESESYKEPSKKHNIEEYEYKIPPHRRKSIFASAKPLLISILSAITIGVLLGFIVLRIGAGGTDATQEASQTPSSTPPVADTTEEDEENADINTIPIELEALQAYVLQAGVYSEKENTDDVVSMFEDHGHTPIVWEENEQYYVFTHLFYTEEQAKNAVGQLDDSDLETYAKLWDTKKETVDMSEEDASFIQDFVKTWNTTVEKHSNNEIDFLESWEQLTEDMPTTDTNTQQLITYLTTEIKETEVAIEIEQVLFDTWKIYAQLQEP